MRGFLFAVIGVLPFLTFFPSASLQAQRAFRDGCWSYSHEQFPEAARHFERAVALDPDMAEAWFFLGNSIEAPSRLLLAATGNEQHARVGEAYSRAIQLGLGASPATKSLRAEAFAALARLHSVGPNIDERAAITHATQLVQEYADDSRALYILAKTYENLDKLAEAEDAYRRLSAGHPKDSRACEALPDFYRRRAVFDPRFKGKDALSMFEQCAALNASDPEGFYKVAAFYWEGAYRDPFLDAGQRDALAEKGIVAADKALELKPNYYEAMLFKALLLRVRAQASEDSEARVRYNNQAAALAARARDLQAKGRQ